MNKIYRSVLLFAIALTGCTGTKLPSPPAINEISQAQVDAIQKKISECISEASTTKDAKYVDQYVIALTANSPNAKELFNSSDKISGDQVVVLKRFKESTLKCRAISDELPSPALVAVYANFYEKIDAVYADLIDGRITIGVANQERSMRIHYAKERWAQIMKTLKASQ